MDFAAKLPAKARALLQRREQQKHSALLEELSDLQLQLNAARSQFDILTDEDMIDACCYQIKALATRYDAPGGQMPGIAKRSLWGRFRLSPGVSLSIWGKKVYNRSAGISGGKDEWP